MIRLISGSTRVGNKTFSPDDGVFDAGKESESYLVSRGAAEYVYDNALATVATVNTDEENASPSVNSSETDEGAEGVLDGSADVPEINIGMSAQELREIGKEIGIKFGIGTTKEEMVRVLKEHYGIADDGEEAPDLSAEIPIV